MRSILVTTLTLTALAAAACNSPQWPEPSRSTMNAWSVNEYHRDSIEAGIISQHTLYPYHFVLNGAALNELGHRDLLVLADHYRDNPGALNLRRAGTGADLYNARLDTVKNLLVEHGVDTERVRFGNQLPGGDGLNSERVLIILEEKMDEPLTPTEGRLSTFGGEAN